MNNFTHKLIGMRDKSVWSWGVEKVLILWIKTGKVSQHFAEAAGHRQQWLRSRLAWAPGPALPLTSFGQRLRSSLSGSPSALFCTWDAMILELVKYRELSTAPYTYKFSGYRNHCFFLSRSLQVKRCLHLLLISRIKHIQICSAWPTHHVQIYCLSTWAKRAKMRKTPERKWHWDAAYGIHSKSRLCRH